MISDANYQQRGVIVRREDNSSDGAKECSACACRSSETLAACHRLMVIAGADDNRHKYVHFIEHQTQPYCKRYHTINIILPSINLKCMQDI